MNVFMPIFRRSTIAAGLILLAFSLHVPTSAWAQGKGGGNGNGGGGNGDDTDSVYNVIRFAPPGVAFDGSSVSALNDAGEAVGGVWSGNGSVSYHLDLVTGLYTAIPGQVESINSSGEMVGGLYDDSQSPDLAYYLPGLGEQLVTLPPLPGDEDTWAIKINEAGIIIGNSRTIPNGGVTAVLWKPVFDDNGELLSIDGPVALSPSEGPVSVSALDINDPLVGNTFQIVGTVGDDAVTWTVELNQDGSLSTPTEPVSLGTLNGVVLIPRAINGLGDLCGSSGFIPFFNPFDGPAQPLEVVSNTDSGFAFDIDDSGQCVGMIETSKPARQDAYLWPGPDAKPIKLEKLLGKNSGWDSLTSAEQINNDGVIGGYGFVGGVRSGFIMWANP